MREQYFPTTPTFTHTHDLENDSRNLFRYPPVAANFDLAAIPLAKFLFVSLCIKSMRVPLHRSVG